MKKFAVAFLAAIMTLSCLMMVSCSCFVVEGTYKFESLTYNGTTYKAGDTFNGRVLNENDMVIEVKNDGTITVTTNNDGTTQSTNGTWKQKEGVLYIFNINGSDVEVTIKNSKATFPVGDEMSFTMKKVFKLL